MTRPLLRTPEQTEAAFYAALEAGDLDAMMAVWCDDPGVSCVHPGGERHLGLAEVRDSWRRIFAGSGRLRFRVAEVVSIAGEDVAVRSVIEHIGVPGVQGTTPVIATNVFRRTSEGWRMWMHHASPHPGIEEAAGEDEEDDGGEDTRGDDSGEEPPPTLH
jgi:ketosteroid isomerase-like protein